MSTCYLCGYISKDSHTNDCPNFKPFETRCQNYGQRPECLRDPDPQYTMNFDDIGESPIYWCSFCGPESEVLSNALTRAIEEGGPEFAVKLERAITEAEYEKRSNQS